ncbi:MAG: DUF1592 domain-containing protein [Nannocystaceae bacterium]|nr:DUF1592 domain-containing protein [Nannocystaceae bacterium]
MVTYAEAPFGEVRLAWLRLVGLLGAAVLVTGCYTGADGGGDGDGGQTDGGSGDAGSGDDGDGPAALACDPDGPSPTPLKRLSARQYRNTLDDLFGSMPAAASAIETALVDLPIDAAEDDGAFVGMDLRLTQRHVTTYYAVADAVANAALEDSAMMSTLAGDCALAPSLDPGCLESFVEDFGLKVHRRPMEDADLDLYLGLVDPERTGPEVYRDVVFAMLMSPAFHYQFETEGPGEAIQELDDYEIASRIAHHFWRSTPDDALLAAAAAGELTTEDGFEAAIERMVSGEGQPRTEETIRQFYRQWLHLEGVAGFVDTPAFNAFSVGLGADDDLIEAARDEIDNLTRFYTWETDGQFADLISSDRSFTDNGALAALYGVSPDASGDVVFPAGQRAGILTRAAMLFSGDEKTNPIFRGIDVRERLLCLTLSPPDAADVPPDAFDPPPLDPEMSTRQRYEVKTAAPECAACHTQINPIGFVQEAYDALGRFRTSELIYDDLGTLLGEQPVDTSVSVDGLGEGTLSFEGPVELMQWLAEDPRVQSCFAKHYFQFTFRRDPTPNDACMVDNLEETLREDSIVNALRAIALEPEFRLRTVED